MSSSNDPPPDGGNHPTEPAETRPAPTPKELLMKRAKLMYDQNRKQIAEDAVAPRASAPSSANRQERGVDLDHLPEAIASAPTYGLNARALILQAASLIDATEQPSSE